MVLNVLSAWSSRTSATELKKSDPSTVEIRAFDGQAKSGVKDTVDAAGPSSSIGSTNTPKQVVSDKLPSPHQAGSVDQVERNKKLRRFSVRPLGLFNGERNIISHDEAVSEQQKANEAAKHSQLSVLARTADKRAQKNALVVQNLIIGPDTTRPANVKANDTSRTQLKKIKSELMQPKSANRVIVKLRELPMPEEHLTNADSSSSPTKSKYPIHAVCLEGSEDEIHSKHFSKLGASSITSASLETVTSLFNEMHIVDLVSAPDFGLGQPEDGKGLLAGAIPTAETIFEGALKLTPQLMALGYATGKAVVPDTTVSPPTDRLSVLTYWWGLELCMPPPTLTHLANVPSVSQQVINFLTALSIMSGGVREILPIVRYIGQYIEFEWTAIQAQDQGQGVVCAATWIMPAALVPRPWDFDPTTTPTTPTTSPSTTTKISATIPAADKEVSNRGESSKTPSQVIVSPLPTINSGPSMLESQKALPITVVA